MSLLDRTSGNTTGSPPSSAAPARFSRGEITVVPDDAEARSAAAAAATGRRAVQRAATGRVSADRYEEIRSRVHARLLEVVDADVRAEAEIKQSALESLAEVISVMGVPLTQSERHAIVEQIIDDVLGLGPLEALLDDPTVSDILVNRWDRVFVERDNRMEQVDIRFEDDAHLMRTIGRILAAVGRRVDESSPMVDARLRDGSRVNVVIAPLSLTGPTLTIRRFSKDPLQVDDLLRLGTCTPGMMQFLRAAVRARLNIVVSGGGSSGKTTTLNILSSFIPEDERIVTIEDAAELQLRQEHVVPLESRPANVEGRGRVTIRNLVINALRMRPDRIVVGECRGAEALDMLQAMNTGHDGSLTTMHANSPLDAVSRLEVMILMAGTDLPSKAIREQIGSAVQLFVHQARVRDGSRKIVRITECSGFDGERVKLRDVFTYTQTGVDEDGVVHGTMGPTGHVPACTEILDYTGNHVSPLIFQAGPRLT